MPLTSGQKLALVGAAGIGAFFLFGGSAKAGSSAPKVDPCVDPKDCATLISCAAPILASATATDIPKLNDLRAKAVSLSCSSLISQIDDKIKSLKGPDKTSVGTSSSIPFNPATVKDKQRLINDAWTLARMGPADPTKSPPPKGLGSDGSFLSYADAVNYANTLNPIMDVKTGTFSPRPPWDVLADMQAAAGITVDGKYYRSDGKQSESDKAFQWALSAGLPTSIGGEACGHETSVAGCAACERGRSEIGAMTTRADYRLGSTAKVDRAFGTGFGAGPKPLRGWAFGAQSMWWPNRGTSGA